MSPDLSTTPPKTVLYVDIDGERGGSANSLRAILQHLDRTRYKPVILLGRQGAERLWEAEDVICMTMAGFHNYDFCMPRHDIRWIYHALLWALRLPYDIIRAYLLLKRISPDLVHLNVGQALSFGIACRAKGTPVVWHIREMVTKNIFTWIQRAVYGKCADHIIFISKGVEARLPDLPCPKTVLYNSITAHPSPSPEAADQFRDSLGIAESNFVVALLGNFTVMKGYIFLAETAELLKDLPDLRFIVAGDSHDRPEGVSHNILRKVYRLFSSAQTDSLRIRDSWMPMVKSGRAFLPGHVDSAATIAISDIIACPTMVPEPFGRTVIEAYAQGKPVIATDGPAFDEIITNGRTGWLVPLDPEEWASRIRHLYYHRDTAVEAGRAGKSACSQFNPKAAAEKIMSIYDELLDARRTL